LFPFSRASQPDEPPLPLIVRLTLYALGAVEGRRIRRPIDPVAAWLVRNYPALVQGDTAPAAYTTIRARCQILDHLLQEEVHRARTAGELLEIWTFGGGFDARWYRMLPHLGETVVAYHEVETEPIARYKARLLDASPYAALWSDVDRPSAEEAVWNVGRPHPTARPVFVLEGLAGRLEPDQLEALLKRLHGSAPRARVLMGLPGHARGQGGWPRARLDRTGWQLDVDIRLAPRGRLMSQNGGELCAGMHGLRAVRLFCDE